MKKTIVENGLGSIRIERNKTRVYSVNAKSYRRLIHTLRNLGYTRYNCGLGVVVWEK
jgi:hypothetical protein